MARHVQRLVFTLPWFCLLAQAQFDHREVFKQKLDCLTCHAAQKESTSLSDKRRGKILKDFNHAQHWKLGAIAPAIRAAIETKQYLASPNKVDLPALQAHLDAAKYACEACHRPAENQLAVGFPHMEDCLVCHNKIDVPYSCADCHPTSLKLKPESHTKDFLDKHSAGLAKLNLDQTTCARCHGQRFTCLGCH
ncbi:MAG: hypothetical protein NW208_12005 [Bryobacter sp.]|nr:hypothetical protein [Bryobacter sp.]